MRQIKFRAWFILNNRYLENQWAYSSVSGLVIEGDENSGVIMQSDDSIVFEQFTGLLDKNGKEIYEGDIVIGSHTTYIFSGGVEIGSSSEIWKGVVEFSEKNPAFYVKETEVRSSKLLSCHEYEVIGNIHENGELLK